jgi:hypothetical protein
MITFQDIAGLVSAEPFRPFRIKLTDGRTVDIRHSDMVSLGVESMTISFYPREDADDLTVPLEDVESVVLLDPSAT